MQIRNVTTLFIAAVCLYLNGCASSQVASSAAVQQLAAQTAEKESITPEQAITEAETLVLEARNAELGFFAPLHLSQAEESIQQAKQYLLAPPKDIKNAALMAAIAAQTFIAKGYENKKSVEGNLKLALAHKAILEQLNTPTELPEEYQDVISDMTDLIKKIEEGKVAEAIEDQNALLNTMAEVEINTLRKQHLTEANAYLEKAKDIDADDYAEVSFANAEKTLEASTNFIRSNYRDRKGVSVAGNEALTASKHAYYVALEAKKRVNLNPAEAEKHILELVAMHNQIYQRAYHHDLEPQGLQDALQKLLEMVDDLKSELLKSNTALTEQTRALSVMRNKMKSDTDNNNTAQPAQSLLPIQNDDITVISVLPGQTEAKENKSVTLKVDEQPFDSIENME